MSQPMVWRSRMKGLRSRRGLVLLLGVAAAFGLLGCSRGAYPFDFFSEMHYQQSYRIEEPPSLSAPSDSVPITGRGLSYTMAQAKLLTNSAPNDAATIAVGANLYRVNCSVCHGVAGKGDGPMKDRLNTSGYAAAPANLTGSGPTAKKSDGEVFQIISKGYAVAYGLPPDRFVMPAWEKLLTEDQRWEIIRYIRSLQQ